MEDRDVAFIALIGEGNGVETALAAVLEDRRGKLQVLTRRPGACVLGDTNMAREFVRDVKAKMASGKLFVFRLDEPQEVFEAGGGESP
jgi:hypothetical protein